MIIGLEFSVPVIRLGYNCAISIALLELCRENNDSPRTMIGAYSCLYSLDGGNN